MIDRARRAFTGTLFGVPLARRPGQGLTEYGLILALAVVVVIVAISVFGNQTTALINRAASSLS